MPKTKDIPPPDNLRLTLYPIGESAALFDNIPGERPITPNMLQVLETLGGFPDCSATPTQLKEACSGHIAKSSYYAALNRLVRMGPHPRIQEDQARAVQHPRTRPRPVHGLERRGVNQPKPVQKHAWTNP
jgi:hypothetical protein